MARGTQIPGGGGRVKLDSQGMRQLLTSNEVRANLVGRMARVQSALPGSKLVAMESRTRIRVKVERGSDFDEANTGDLSKALDLADGQRGDFNNKQLAKRRAKRKARARKAGGN